MFILRLCSHAESRAVPVLVSAAVELGNRSLPAQPIPIDYRPYTYHYSSVIDQLRPMPFPVILSSISGNCNSSCRGRCVAVNVCKSLAKLMDSCYDYTNTCLVRSQPVYFGVLISAGSWRDSVRWRESLCCSRDHSSLI